MKIIPDKELEKNNLNGVVLTLGNFDGVHLGHQEVLKRVVRRSRELNTSSMVFTFEPHPVRVLAPNKGLLLLSTMEERKKLIEHFDIDFLYFAHFTDEFARKHPEEFVNEIILRKINPKKIIVGHDYSFGRERKGGIDLLRRIGDKAGFKVEVVSAYMIDGQPVSSSLIRDLIGKGEVKKASNLLGRCYSLKGQVVRGNRRGTTIGFPTANVKPEKELLPRTGVYALLVLYDNKIYNGVCNIGYNPTFNDNSGRLSTEVFLIDFEGDLYSRTVELFFVERLRDETQFSAPEQLAGQIKRDIEEAKKLLAVQESPSAIM